MASFNRECAMWYAQKDKLDVGGEMKDKALQRVLTEHVGKRQFTCDACEHYIKDDDEVCWFCGSDVTEGDEYPGGWDEFKEKKKVSVKEYETPKVDAGDSTKKKKKIHVQDRTSDKAPASKEASIKKKPAKPGKEVAKKGGDDAVSVLGERVTRIRELDRNTGANAWQIGLELIAIVEGDEYKVGGHKTFDAFCQKELGYDRKSAYRFMEVARNIDKEDAKKLGVFKLVQLARAPEEVRPKLLKAAMGKEDGGKGLSREELAEEIRKAKENGGGEKKDRKVKSPYLKFIGSKFRGKREENRVVFTLDDDVGIAVNVKSKVATAEFVQL